MSAAGPTDDPYVGLRAFEADEWDRFFGRDRWVRIVVGNLVASRLTLLYGESGVGKTSLLQAGVEHDLRDPDGNGRGRPTRSRLEPVVFRTWQGDPVQPLIAKIWEQGQGTNGDRAPPETLADVLREVSAQNGSRVVVVLDQFEEYLLYHGHHEGPGSLPSQLSRLLEEPRLAASVLISIREDALSRMDALKRAIPHLFDNLLHLERVDAHTAEEAITGPIDWYNRTRAGGAHVEIEPALVEAVLHEASAEQNGAAGRTVEFAYLQLVLERLWHEAAKLGTNRLGLELLQRVPGGAEEIVRDHVRRAVESLSDVDRDLAAEVFRYLVTPSGAKVAYTVSDLAAQVGCEAADISRLTDELSAADARIVRPVGVLSGGEVSPGVEIFHDKLAGPILHWRAEQMRRRERRRAHEEAQAAERRRRRRLLAGLGLGAGVVLIALLGLLLWQTSRNTQLERSSRLASASTAQLDRNPELSMLLGQAAVEEDARDVTVEALRAGIVESRLRRVFPPVGTRSQGLSNAAMTADGRTLVTGGRGGEFRIWDVPSGTTRAGPFRLLERGPVQDIEISSDQTGVLVTDEGATEIRSLDSGHIVGRIPQPAPKLAVADADFDGSGSLVLIAYNNGLVRRWIDHGPPADRIKNVADLGAKANSVAVSPDGKQAIVTTADGAFLIRPPKLHGRPRTLLAGQTGRAAFSSSGHAAFGGGSAVYLWDRSARRPIRLAGHTQPISSVTFSPNGRILATGSMDQTVRLWDVRSGRLLTVLGGHSAGIRGVAFTPSGGRVATSSIDGTARVWVPESGRPVLVLRGHAGPVKRVFFGAGGTLATISLSDGRARIWEVDPGRDTTPTGARGPSSYPAPRRSARSADGGVRARALARRVEVLRHGRKISLSHPGVRDMAFSPDGSALVTSGGKTARVWDPATGRALAMLGEHGNRVMHATFSPDPRGRFVLDVSRDGCARLWLWGVGGGALVARFPRQPCRELRGKPELQVRSARFSRDGRAILLTNAEGRVSRFECRECAGADELIALAKQRVARARSGAERERNAAEETQ